MKPLLTLLLSTCFASLLPAEEVFFLDFSQPYFHVESSSLEVSYTIGPRVYYHYCSESGWAMYEPGESFIQIGFLNDADTYQKAWLTLTHLADCDDEMIHAPITISVNDAVVLKGFSPTKEDFTTDHFDLTGLLQDGPNVLKISLDEEASCAYEIKSLSLGIEED